MTKYLTINETAEIFRRHPRTIYRWIEEGFLHAIKVRDGYLVPYEEVERILREGLRKNHTTSYDIV